MAKCCSQKAAKVTLGFSVCVLILSVVMVFVFGAIYNKILKKDITLENGTLVTNIWKDIPIPIYEKVYFFNITNTEQFLAGKEPLNVSEVGPYTYKSRWVKKNPQWNANNTVSYREVRTYTFVPEMSVGLEEDFVYTLNGPLIIAAFKFKDLNALDRFALSVFLLGEGEKLVTRKSIKELTYSGYKDGIMKWAKRFIKNLPYQDGIFSWLYGKNATDDGLFTVFTGTDDASKTNFINNWNGNELLSYWKGDTCNSLNATSIETGPPIHGYQESYTFFQSLVCRSLTFNYTRDQTHLGIRSKRFKSTYDLLANASENPENYCFNINGERPSGVLDLSPCQFGAPVYMSFPHFYFADPLYLNSVNGLKPIEEIHESHVDVEPITGFSIDIAVRVQINVEIPKVSGIWQLEKAKEGIYPIFWIEVLANIDEDMASFLKRQVRLPKILAYSIISILGAISFVLIIVSVRFLCITEVSPDAKPLIDATNKRTSHLQGYENKVCSNYSTEKELKSGEMLVKEGNPNGYYGTDDAPLDYNKIEDSPPDYSNIRRNSPDISNGIQDNN